ncbi:Insertion sequence IS5376 putative ATP-binding protein [Bradyrhizobium ivorense]|nr:Insertion sequence IS5376 putative ATP-binding protein [Bradyrhizobium ivorense]
MDRSVIVTYNRVVQDWGTYLGDNTMSTTILDRLMHHCHLLEFDGRSYRLKEAAEALAHESKSKMTIPSVLPRGWRNLTDHTRGI